MALSRLGPTVLSLMQSLTGLLSPMGGKPITVDGEIWSNLVTSGQPGECEVCKDLQFGVHRIGCQATLAL